jgi:hypothetical protein
VPTEEFSPYWPVFTLWPGPDAINARLASGPAKATAKARATAKAKSKAGASGRQPMDLAPSRDSRMMSP